MLAMDDPGKPARPRTPRAGAVELDSLLTVFEQAARAWGRLQESPGAPATVEVEIVNGCTRLRDLLAAVTHWRPGDAERAALTAARLQRAVRDFEAWKSERR
jgi:hypothetical protein